MQLTTATPAAPIPVTVGTIGQTTGQTCNARDLHQGLKVGRDFSNWIKGRIAEFGFQEGEDFAISLAKSGEQDAQKIGNWGGANRTDYLLTLDMAKELAMLENNETGRSVRRYFIACEKRQAEPQTLTPELARVVLHALRSEAAKEAGLKLTIKGTRPAFKCRYKLTEEQVLEVIDPRNKVADLVKKLGVGKSTIYRIRGGETRQDVTGFEKRTNYN